MIKIQKDGVVLEVTKGSYNDIYKAQGFKPVEKSVMVNDKDAIEIPFICKKDKPYKNEKKKR
jgi:hypothetical protein